MFSCLYGCGVTVEFHEGINGWYSQCTECLAKGKVFETKKLAMTIHQSLYGLCYANLISESLKIRVVESETIN